MHSAKLVWVTPNAEKLIARIARVSNPKNENNDATAERLLKYCIKHKHWSVFEMASMCVEIHTTRAISPQILRHRSFSFQEFSQRYAIPTDTFATVLPDLRRQDTKNRQNSIDDLDPKDTAFLTTKIKEHFNSTMDLYQQLLDKGVAKECARGVLPMNTVTTVMMVAPIRTWLHYIALRRGNGTQEEHARIARSCHAILKEHCPIICEAFFQHTPFCNSNIEFILRKVMTQSCLNSN